MTAFAEDRRLVVSTHISSRSRGISPPGSMDTSAHTVITHSDMYTYLLIIVSLSLNRCDYLYLNQNFVGRRIK